MSGDYTPNERTRDIVEIRNQPDGPGLRYGKQGEVSTIGKVVPGGAARLRERIGQFQAESRYWEGLVGSVHGLRIILLNDDSQIMVTVTYDGDFRPYLEDIFREAGPWFDAIMKDVWEGYETISSPGTRKLISDSFITAEAFYVTHHDVTVRDITKLKRVGAAVSELLDAAS